MAISADMSNLRKFRDKLSEVSLDAHFTKAQTDANQIVFRQAQSRVPTLTGKARSSVRITGTRVEGGVGVPYFGWLDFGGSVGRRGLTRRPYLKTGRYIWKAFADNQVRIMEMMDTAAIDAFREAGVDIER